MILLAFFRYGLNGLYELTASPLAQTASGVVGCAIFAAPPSVGASPSASKTCSTVPSSRSAAAARRARPSRGISEQVGPVEKEAGVCRQL